MRLIFPHFLCFTVAWELHRCEGSTQTEFILRFFSKNFNTQIYQVTVLRTSFHNTAWKRVFGLGDMQKISNIDTKYHIMPSEANLSILFQPQINFHDVVCVVNCKGFSCRRPTLSYWMPRSAYGTSSWKFQPYACDIGAMSWSLDRRTWVD